MIQKIMIFSLLCVTQNVNSAKILGLFGFPSKSHHILGSTLLKALAARGHEVTMLSPFPQKSSIKNYEDIDLPGLLEYKDSNANLILQTQNMSFMDNISVKLERMTTMNELLINHTALHNLLATKRKFDLVIVAYLADEVNFVIPYLLDAYTIVFSTLGTSVMMNWLTGNSAPYAYIPNTIPHFPDELTFLERTANALTTIAFQMFHSLIMIPNQDALVQKYFPGAPSVSELAQNISLVLLNAHFSIESARPYLPHMIQIGGFHVEEPKELTGDLKEFMDKSSEGVIFFSLGSNVRSSDLPPNVIEGILKTFAKLPQKVLWKFESNTIPNLPSNVKIGKWLPQRDILAHPNIKLFITHGGLLSTTEAIYHGVPMIGIPIFADQDGNVIGSEDKGFLVKISLNELSEETLSNAIQEVLQNPRYRENIQLRSRILKDRPIKPLDNAVYWVEYVLRHRGAHHLKNKGLKLVWYQYYLLDVIGLVVGVLITITALLYLIISKLCKSSKGMIRKLLAKPAIKPKKDKKKKVN